MENAADALIMAFGVLVFVLALSISISLLGQVRETSTVVFSLIDRENDYIYVDNSNIENSTRKVGIDTVVSSIYRAYTENYRIVFLKSSGGDYPIYKTKLDMENKEINTIDLELEIFRKLKNENSSAEPWTKNVETIQDFVNCLISGQDSNYFDKIYEDGLYKALENKNITEYLGEYYQEDVESINSTADINKTKKRIITYVIEN